MIESAWLLIVIIVMVLFGSYEFASFFFDEKKHRAFWIKWWIVVSIMIGIFFWIILQFWG